jgi:hypothetical protein
MQDKILFTYNPWTYYKSYINVLENVRKYYTDSDIIIFFDSNRVDLDLYLKTANEYNCNVVIRDCELGFINRNDSMDINSTKQFEWISRIKLACDMSNAEWVMLLEDDVLLKREIRNWPNSDIGTNREYFRTGGGSVFRRSVFLESIEKVDVLDLISTILHASWAGDVLLEHIFRSNNVKHEKWIELAEPNYYDKTDHAVFHGYKDLHKLG